MFLLYLFLTLNGFLVAGSMNLLAIFLDLLLPHCILTIALILCPSSVLHPVSLAWNDQVLLHQLLLFSLFCDLDTFK